MSCSAVCRLAGLKRSREELWMTERPPTTCAVFPTSHSRSAERHVGATEQLRPTVKAFASASVAATCPDTRFEVTPAMATELFDARLHQECGYVAPNLSSSPTVTEEVVPYCFEVSVVRGDTGKEYRFTFTVPSTPTYGMHDTVAHAAHRNAVVGNLVNQIFCITSLSGDCGWVVVFHGRNILSEAGAESLLSALRTKNSKNIHLSAFRTFEK
ncbi:hypothetical protein ERJ75_000770600 [Trypanosoma vivax]|uniref:Uncharacterized protein n=1 Tax=Trypanosoma vivax (strain Y486) TaxID=1055687 RepID=G0U3M8_TRYVY|nr:hypothetical protein TRVL_05229 [Trypanosoma vivax]KAH8614026.1 hypothetical protein ERJ75_000770600 [Trypanosoma vivax]CCC50885.1 conserved hypothetical protein [Trypanosoma vivax Y486]